MLTADHRGRRGGPQGRAAQPSPAAQDRDPREPVRQPSTSTSLLTSSYDILCIEGLARSLRVFLDKEAPPTYTLATPAVMQEVFVEPSTSPLRPMFASVVLRLARPMNQLEYESFIDFQDKLHQNLCRMRRFVAIGTHDLDTVEGPFR